MIPGKPVITKVTITNVGATRAKTIALVPAGSCVQQSTSTAIDVCSSIDVTITAGPTTVFSGTAKELGDATVRQLRMPDAPGTGQHIDFTFTATLDRRAGNDYMKSQAQVPIRWTLIA